MRLSLSLAATATLVALAAPASAITTTYVANLSGGAEAPPNASLGTGTATVVIDDFAQTMHVIATFSGLTGNVTASHIHCCTAVAGAGTVGVATVTPTFTGFPSGVQAGSYDHLFDMTLAASWNPPFVTAHGGSTSQAFTDLLAGINTGKAYFNIHSSTIGGGEIRGFLAPVPEPGSYSLMLAGLGVMGWVARRRQRA